MTSSAGVLRAAGLAATVLGAVGSTVLLLDSGPNAPVFLKILFTLWVISPFALLLAGELVSTGWSSFARTTLYSVMLAMTPASLVLYRFDDMLRPRNAPNAFMFVAIPPASWLTIAMVVVIIALISRRRDVKP